MPKVLICIYIKIKLFLLSILTKRDIQDVGEDWYWHRMSRKVSHTSLSMVNFGMSEINYGNDKEINILLKNVGLGEGRLH
jgi:hypothetical protein